ncbi:MAG: acyl carrier protein [Desulfarculus sp.]|nr:acyl carrier protein [Desulfarculus sp.]
MRDDIKQVMAQVFRLPADQIPDTAKINNLLNWDSLGHIQLMLALEDRFGLRISAENILKLQTLEAIEQFLAPTAPAAPPA